MKDLSMTAMTKGDALDLWPLLDRKDGTFRLAHRWPIPPEIHLDGAEIRYGRGRFETWVKDPNSKFFTDFLNLADETPKRIEWYAKRWGVLGLCQHQLVAGHEFNP